MERKELWKIKNYKEIYNITIEDYNNLLLLQDNKCKICKKDYSNEKKKLAVDHCHVSGKVRGLLCTKCNMCLGGVNDNIEILKEMILYLKENG